MPKRLFRINRDSDDHYQFRSFGGDGLRLTYEDIHHLFSPQDQQRLRNLSPNEALVVEITSFSIRELGSLRKAKQERNRSQLPMRCD